MLQQILYSSRAIRPMQAADLEKILIDARTGNEARGITGALVYVNGVFLQILEGEAETLEPLVAAIRADSRHDSMKVFHQCEVAERAFSAWSMAYLSPELTEMSRWAGLEGTATVDDLLQHVQADPRRVPRILVSIVEAIAAQSKTPRA